MKKGFSVCGALLAVWLVSSPSFADETTNAGKLDRILRNQEEILQKLDEIRSELVIVKVRATNG